MLGAALMSLLFLLAGVGEAAAPAVLHRFSWDAETVTIAVTDCGCTELEDFGFAITPLPKGQRDVTVIRVRADHCEATPQLVEFVYSRKTIKLQSAKVINVTNKIEAFSGDPTACGQ